MKHYQTLIEQIRSFNRYYTNVIGLLDQNFLESPFSLTEGRVLYEINHIEDCSAKKIRENIAIDEGYLSRILDKFRRKGLITKSPSRLDGRLQVITITAKGRAEFSRMNDHSNQLISGIIQGLSDDECQELVDKMERIRALLSRQDETLNAEK